MRQRLTAFAGTVRRMVRQFVCRRAMRIVMNMANDRALAQLACVPANPDCLSYQDGWEAFAKLLRARLAREGYLPNSDLSINTHKPNAGAELRRGAP